MSYKDSGVNREAGDAFVEGFRVSAEKMRRPEILGGIGDFGSYFESPQKYKQPVWVASTDGVGTKLLLAEQWASTLGYEIHQGIGQDVVAMCVNDIAACRAEPVVFLDYIATDRIRPEILDHLMIGIVKACENSGCSLVGGETAEMPGYYPLGRYDVAGFSVGVIEKSKIFKRDSIKAGDVILGLSSDGFHSNGYSLVRKVLAEQKWSEASIISGQKMGHYLLQPTRLYVNDFLKADSLVEVKGAAHITGGGLVENLPRRFDESKYKAIIEVNRCNTSDVMKAFVKAAHLEQREAFSTWNMGIGFCIIVETSSVNKLTELGWQVLGEIQTKTAAHEDSVVLS